MALWPTEQSTIWFLVSPHSQINVSIGVMLGLYWDSGKENGNYYLNRIEGVLQISAWYSVGAAVVRSGGPPNSESRCWGRFSWMGY